MACEDLRDRNGMTFDEWRHVSRPLENAEHMTFREWRRAAQCFGARVPYVVALRAWAYGEDPTEHAGR